MAGHDELQSLVDSLLPAVDVSLDAVCVVNAANEIVYLNGTMRAFLKLRPSAIQDRKVRFCDVVSLSICGKRCQVEATIKEVKPARFEEIPASRAEEKLRLTLKIAPFRKPAPGALISLRDVTGDFLLQAKYHKTLGILDERNHRITELEDQLSKLRGALRRSRDAV